jgi:hypothetical protein
MGTRQSHPAQRRINKNRHPTERAAALFLQALECLTELAWLAPQFNIEGTHMTENLIIKTKPPANAQRVNAWHDLPLARDPARYRITNSNGETREVTLKQGNRQILEGLMCAPMYCASPVRVSDRVLTLKTEFGIAVETKDYEPENELSGRFGVYFLISKVERIGGPAK